MKCEFGEISELIYVGFLPHSDDEINDVTGKLKIH